MHSKLEESPLAGQRTRVEPTNGFPSTAEDGIRSSGKTFHTVGSMITSGELLSLLLDQKMCTSEITAAVLSNMKATIKYQVQFIFNHIHIVLVFLG